MKPGRAGLFVAALVVSGAGACTSIRLPARVPTFKDSELVRTSSGGVGLAARPVDARELNWELFDEHLPDAGLAPVWVAVHNGSAAPVDLSGARWTLRLGGRSLPALDRDAILKRFYKVRKIRMYTLQTHERARAELDRLMLGARTIPPGESSSGFLFLKVELSDAPTWSRGDLTVRGLRSGDRELELSLPLSHGRP
jgi:hypothetical protein